MANHTRLDECVLFGTWYDTPELLAEQPRPVTQERYTSKLSTVGRKPPAIPHNNTHTPPAPAGKQGKRSYSSPVASLVLTDSSQLTSDSLHLDCVAVFRSVWLCFDVLGCVSMCEAVFGLMRMCHVCGCVYTLSGRTCKSDDNCAGIANTTCMNDPRDNKMRCLCPDKAGPINGHCPPKKKVEKQLGNGWDMVGKQLGNSWPTVSKFAQS
uniref:Uncharacterized protein n=1 Tax=Timema poppense TaxID=170557 RepID=A0A7R9CZF1_TIMPO|nr:unnamed protein product [Timema poppensis]